mgnify:CR=1 FL=1|tara:strand:+ start:11041 stop:11511 length:471 start_codon:yes stop_codon:yes gene_type:complete
MKRLMSQVREFADCNAFPLDKDVRASTPLIDPLVSLILLRSAEQLEATMRELDEVVDCDLRISRAHLIVEELAELIRGMAAKDVIETSDGIADLAYVVAGTAAAFGLPLEALCDEVHASNMSKEMDGAHKPEKGVHYFKPDIRGVLERNMVLRSQR